MKRFLTLALIALVGAFALTSCGGNSHQATKPVRPTTSVSHCVPGEGHMGCSVTNRQSVTRRVGLPSNEGLLPDVYEGDSIYSWSQASHYIVGAIVKAWEYRTDHAFVSNWQQLSALHKWHDAYLFLHSCNEVYGYVNAVNSVGGFNQPNTGPPILDVETPDADVSCAVHLVEQLTHRRAIIYTGPGTWPGGDHGDAYLWGAAYGDYSHGPCVWTCTLIAWQYTDGEFGPYPHQIPGIQPGDISVSYGIQHLVVTPPDPYRIFPKNKWSLPYHQQASEYNTVKLYELANCHTPWRRLVCKSSGWHLQLLRDRIYWVATHRYTNHGWVSIQKPRWSADHLGQRFHRIEFDITH